MVVGWTWLVLAGVIGFCVGVVMGLYSGFVQGMAHARRRYRP